MRSSGVTALVTCSHDLNTNTTTLVGFAERAGAGSAAQTEFTNITLDRVKNPGDYLAPGEIQFQVQAANGGGVVDSGKYEMPLGLYNASIIDWMTVRAGN